jgi:hypothetical protein
MDKIRNYMLTYERGRAEDWLIGVAEQFSASVRETDFDSAAADRGMIKKTFGPLPLNYGDITLFPSVSSSGISELNDAANNDRFWQAAYSTPLNTPSAPVVLGSNVVVLYPLEEVEADSDNIALIEMYYSYWLSTTTEQEFRSFFMNNEKFDDRFWDVFQYFLY